MTSPGTFSIEDDGMGDDDIVRLDAKGGVARRGWVNVGAYAVLIEVDDSGDLSVQAYPAGAETQPLAAMSATREQAQASGAVDFDGTKPVAAPQARI